MGAIGIKKAAYDSADVDDKFLFEASMTRVGMGQPAVYLDGGGVEWYVWDDYRLVPRDVENMAALAKNLPDMPTVTIVRDYEVVEGEDPLTAAAQAQDVPSWFQAASQVPLSWVPVEGD